MKFNNKGIAAIPILMFLAAIGYMKGVEHIDRHYISKHKYDAGLVPDYRGEVGAPGSTREWKQKGWETLKIDAGASGHDAHALPPGLTVNPNYVVEKE
jgi:hypothetical protein